MATPSTPVRVIAPVPSTPTTTRSPLSKRAFTLSLLPPTIAQPIHSRHLKRIHVAAEIMKAAKVCAGDVLVLRGMEELDQSMEGMSFESTASSKKAPQKFAVGVAWPSWDLSGTTIALSPLLLANAGLTPGSVGSISTLKTANIQVVECERVVLIYDLKGSRASNNKGKGKEEVTDSFFEAYVREVVVGIKFLSHHHFIEVTYNGILRRLLVSSLKATPSSPPASSTEETIHIISLSTSIVFKPPIAPLPKTKAATTTAVSHLGSAPRDGGDLEGYERIGGLEKQIEMIRELVEWPLTRPELFGHFGLKPPRGILLYGPPGTGKTLLALSIAKSLQCNLFSIAGPSLSSSSYGETERSLRSVFAAAKKASPSVIVIDEIDSLAPGREDGGEVERRVVATLLMLMDGLDDKDEAEGEEEGEKPRVVVIAATNRVNAIDSALRRPGRFDKEIEIGVPDATSRLSILQVLLRKTPHNIPLEDLQTLAAKTHGFVGADLSSLIHTAGLAAIKRSYSSSSTFTPSVQLTTSDLNLALLSTRPSALREVFLETPKVYWKDIGGQSEVKARLKESIEWPLLHPETFKRLGVKPPRGILLYGPPGCSKTLIAKALATEGGLNFIAVKGPEVFNKYVGESEKAIRDLFLKARASAPSIIFLDEIDAIAPARGSDEGSSGVGDRVLLSLLTEMDGIEELNGVIVLAATNRPDVIDPALMRPGRLDRILYVAPPDLASRREIFRVNFGKMAINPDVEIEELALLTDGCSGAEVVSICQDAALNAMNENIETLDISRIHFVTAAKSVRRRITADVIQGYEEWRDRSGLRSA